jgi:hypothetical protein
MDKFFKNMDNRYKSIEQELKYNFDSKFWEQAETELNNAELDNAFTKAAEQATVSSNIDFNDIDDAFLDEAFVEAAKNTQFEYQTAYWTDYTQVENSLYYDDAFVTAAAMSKAVYDSNYWQDADLALQAEGLHHEYKPEYWKEAKKLLVQDSRKGFFFKWGIAATILLVLSFLTYNFNQHQINDVQLSDNHTNQTDVNQIDKINNQTESKSNGQIMPKENSHNLLDNSNALKDNEVNNTLLTTQGNDTYNSSNKNEQLERINGNNLSKAKGTIKNSSTVSNDINHSTQLTEPGGILNNLVDGQTIDKNTTAINSKLNNEVNNEIEKREDLAHIHFNNKSLEHVSNNYLPKGIESKRIDITSIDIKPTHVFSAELSKGIGNNFNNDNFSFRNSLYLSYELIPYSPKIRNLSYGVDVGVYHQNLNNYEYESQYAVYHIEGNVDHYWYKMVYKDLVYFSTKANVYYSIAPKHNIKLGLGIDKLLTSRIDMQYKINSDLTQNNNSAQWGVNNGFNNLDFSINLGYDFIVNSNFAFTINAKHGILDKTNDEYLDLSKSDIDKSLLLGIKYTFLRK